MVLQNEDGHRVLGNANTKYDTLITHIWAPKTTQNDKSVMATMFANKTDITYFWSMVQPTGCLGPGPPSEMALKCDRTQRHMHTFIAYLCILNGLKQTLAYDAEQQYCPTCYSPCWDEKLFSVKVRSAIFTSKCTRNCLAITMLPRIP